MNIVQKTSIISWAALTFALMLVAAPVKAGVTIAAIAGVGVAVVTISPIIHHLLTGSSMDNEDNNHKPNVTVNVHRRNNTPKPNVRVNNYRSTSRERGTPPPIGFMQTPPPHSGNPPSHHPKVTIHDHTKGSSSHPYHLRKKTPSQTTVLHQHPVSSGTGYPPVTPPSWQQGDKIVRKTTYRFSSPHVQNNDETVLNRQTVRFPSTSPSSPGLYPNLADLHQSSGSSRTPPSAPDETVINKKTILFKK